MLSDEQKKQIEAEYAEFHSMGEVGYLNGIQYMLNVIGEDELKSRLSKQYQ